MVVWDFLHQHYVFLSPLGRCSNLTCTSVSTVENYPTRPPCLTKYLGSEHPPPKKNTPQVWWFVYREGITPKKEGLTSQGIGMFGNFCPPRSRQDLETPVFCRKVFRRDFCSKKAVSVSMLAVLYITQLVKI